MAFSSDTAAGALQPTSISCFSGWHTIIWQLLYCPPAFYARPEGFFGNRRVGQVANCCQPVPQAAEPQPKGGRRKGRLPFVAICATGRFWAGASPAAHLAATHFFAGFDDLERVQYNRQDLYRL